MRKFLFFFFALFAILLFASSTFALTIQSNANYSIGENFIASISGVFKYPLSSSNIQFYHGHDSTSFGFVDPIEINGVYYINFTIPIGKSPGNYTLSIEGATYQNGPSSYTTATVSKDFVITPSMSFVSISPSFTISKDYYYNLSVRNNLGEGISLSYGAQGTASQNLTLGPYETKTVTLPTPSNGTFENVLFRYGNETYSSLVYSELNGTSFEVYTNNSSPAVNSSNGTNLTNKTSPGTINGTNASNARSMNTTNTTNVSGITSNGTNVTNMTANGSGADNLQTCAQMGFPVCNSTQQCNGALVNGLDAQCCNGECTAQSSGNSSLGLVGWIIIIAIVLLVALFFFFKFSKARRMPIRFPGKK